MRYPRRWSQQWTHSASSDRGSLPLALLVVIVAGALVALVIPMVTVQTQSTTFNQSRTQELSAAQSGLAVGMGQIRAASSLATLPCAAPLTGSTTGGASPTYSTSISYYLTNPSGKDAGWLAGNVISCSSLAATPPQYALVRSTGTDARSTRTLQSVYAFINGGTVSLWSTDAQRVCLTAKQPVSPGIGVVAFACTMTAGKPDPTVGQVWVYTSDGLLKLSSTDATGAMCLTSGGGFKLAPCDSGSLAQRWALDAKIGRISGQGGCISSAAAGGTLALATCAATRATDATLRWVMSPYAGAGTAGKQPVGNYRQYVNFVTARCIDGGDGAGKPAVARMCLTVTDYATSAQGVSLNTVTNKLQVGSGGCLSPVTVGAVTTAQVVACGSAATWTVGSTDRSIKAVGLNQCLSVATSTKEYASDGFPTLKLATCDGSALLQWVPRSETSGLFDLREVH